MIGDLVRIFCVSLAGAGLVFLVQPWLFQSGIVAITDVEVETWLAEKYAIGASVVYGTALAASLSWYAIAAKAKVSVAGEVLRLRPFWGLLILLPIVGIGIALSFFNNSNEALLWLTFFYVGDVVVVYWLATAIGSPGLFKFVPPGAILIRSLFPGLK
jgi:hypothetical protein